MARSSRRAAGRRRRGKKDEPREAGQDGAEAAAETQTPADEGDQQLQQLQQKKQQQGDADEAKGEEQGAKEEQEQEQNAEEENIAEAKAQAAADATERFLSGDADAAEDTKPTHLKRKVNEAKSALDEGMLKRVKKIKAHAGRWDIEDISDEDREIGIPLWDVRNESDDDDDDDGEEEDEGDEEAAEGAAEDDVKLKREGSGSGFKADQDAEKDPGDDQGTGKKASRRSRRSTSRNSLGEVKEEAGVDVKAPETDAMKEEADADKKEKKKKKTKAKAKAKTYRKNAEATEHHVRLDPIFSKVLKPHQAVGVRFLWSHVQSARHGGCVLADYMGLGKTLQNISLMHTFLKHHKDETDPKRKTTVLVVSPTSVILNWYREIRKWLNQNNAAHKRALKLFNVRVLDTKTGSRIEQRLEVLEKWQAEGGVLLTGYEMFRSLAQDPKEGKESEGAQRARDLLVDGPGPSLVIVDEGHRLRHAKSQIVKVMSRIKTRRRVVLTGYPLQNHLEEYWCMVNFARPGFLRTSEVFKHQFKIPIENGQALDSAPVDVKLARSRTIVLNDLLRNIILRRDSQHLARELPPKYEWVLRCRLTSKQAELYRAFARNRVDQAKTREWGGKSSVSQNGGIIAAYHHSLSIVNHPDIIFAKYRENTPRGNERGSRDDAYASMTVLVPPDLDDLEITPEIGLIAKSRSDSTLVPITSVASVGKDVRPNPEGPWFETFDELVSVNESSCVRATFADLFVRKQASARERNEPLRIVVRRWHPASWTRVQISAKAAAKPAVDPELSDDDLLAGDRMIERCKEIEANRKLAEMEDEDGIVAMEDEPATAGQGHSLSWAHLVLKSYEPGAHLNDSGKMVVLFAILRHARQQNDKVIVFSQSVQTLNLVQKIIEFHNSRVEEQLKIIDDDDSDSESEGESGSDSDMEEDDAEADAADPEKPAERNENDGAMMEVDDDDDFGDAPSKPSNDDENAKGSAGDEALGDGEDGTKKRKRQRAGPTRRTRSRTVRSASEEPLSAGVEGGGGGADEKGRAKANGASSKRRPRGGLAAASTSTRTATKSDKGKKERKKGAPQEDKAETAKARRARRRAKKERRRAIEPGTDACPYLPGVRVGFSRLDGATPQSTRNTLVDAFNAAPIKEKSVFLASTRAAGEGLNLQSANRVVMFDACWNPCLDHEAMCRAYRFGQKKPVYVYRLVAAGTMERTIFDQQTKKESLTSRVVDARATKRTVLSSDLRNFFNLKRFNQLQQRSVNAAKLLEDLSSEAGDDEAAEEKEKQEERAKPTSAKRGKKKAKDERDQDRADEDEDQDATDEGNDPASSSSQSPSEKAKAADKADDEVEAVTDPAVTEKEMQQKRAMRSDLVLQGVLRNEKQGGGYITEFCLEDLLLNEDEAERQTEEAREEALREFRELQRIEHELIKSGRATETSAAALAASIYAQTSGGGRGRGMLGPGGPMHNPHLLEQQMPNAAALHAHRVYQAQLTQQLQLGHLQAHNLTFAQQQQLQMYIQLRNQDLMMRAQQQQQQQQQQQFIVFRHLDPSYQTRLDQYYMSKQIAPGPERGVFADLHVMVLRKRMPNAEEIIEELQRHGATVTNDSSVACQYVVSTLRRPKLSKMCADWQKVADDQARATQTPQQAIRSVFKKPAWVAASIKAGGLQAGFVPDESDQSEVIVAADDAPATGSQDASAAGASSSSSSSANGNKESGVAAAYSAAASEPAAEKASSGPIELLDD